MRELIEQLANENNVSVDKVNYIFIAFSCRLTTKIPELKQIVDDVFTNTEDEIPQTHLNKLIIALQEQQRKKTFGKWIIPERYEITHREGRYPLF